MKWWHTLKFFYASLRLVKDPNRLDEVFAMLDKLRDTNRTMMQDIADDARRSSQVAAVALRELPRVGRIDVAALARLPQGTLGRAHAEFLQARNLDPGALPLREAFDDPTFVEAHLYETHDMWHTLTGFDTDVAGELGLQGFYAAQIPGKLPIALLAVGMLNTLLYKFEDRHRRLDAITQGYTLGRRAKRLFGLRWAELWETPLDELRRELQIDPVRVSPAVVPQVAPAGHLAAA